MAEEELQEQETRKKEIRSFYFYDHNQGNEYSENIIAVLLPSGATIFIKRRIKGDQVLISLKNCLNSNVFLKLWKDNKGNLLYNITTISEPLFTHLYLSDIYGGTESVDNENNIITITIDDKNGTKYKIQLHEEFLKTIGQYMKDELALSLYHLYISPLI